MHFSTSSVRLVWMGKFRAHLTMLRKYTQGPSQYTYVRVQIIPRAPLTSSHKHQRPLTCSNYTIGAHVHWVYSVHTHSTVHRVQYTRGPWLYSIEIQQVPLTSPQIQQKPLTMQLPVPGHVTNRKPLTCTQILLSVGYQYSNIYTTYGLLTSTQNHQSSRDFKPWRT